MLPLHCSAYFCVACALLFMGFLKCKRNATEMLLESWFVPPLQQSISDWEPMSLPRSLLNTSGTWGTVCQENVAMNMCSEYSAQKLPLQIKVHPLYVIKSVTVKIFGHGYNIGLNKRTFCFWQNRALLCCSVELLLYKS